MKTSLQSIDTTDRYYLNYDKRKFQNFINDNLEASKSDCSLLDDQKVVELTNAAKPDQKSPISFSHYPINQEIFSKAKERLDDLLKTSVVGQTIKRLVDHGDIKSWEETVLDFHKRSNTKKLEFCGNTITDKRIKKFEANSN